MEILIDIDSNLNDNQPLYRIVDFFAATDVISTQKLRFSRADTFQDQNEGIDRLLRQIQYGTRFRCGGMGWSDIESAKQAHFYTQKSHFISCWTTNPESVAMWSLYSPDHTSVRLKTSVGKLRKTLLNVLSKKSLMRLSEVDIGKRIVVCVGARISSVDYEPLHDLLYKVTRRAKAHDRLFDQYTRRNQKIPTIISNPSRFYARQAERKFKAINSNATCNLKDTSFEHEHEVRVVLKFGEEVCTASVLEQQQWIDPAHEYHSLLKEHMKFWGLVRLTDLPNYEFANCTNDFIESISIDPRCPKYKREFMENWFASQNVHIDESHCFGYIANAFTVFPEK